MVYPSMCWPTISWGNESFEYHILSIMSQKGYMKARFLAFPLHRKKRRDVVRRDAYVVMMSALCYISATSEHCQLTISTAGLVCLFSMFSVASQG